MKEESVPIELILERILLKKKINREQNSKHGKARIKFIEQSRPKGTVCKSIEVRLHVLQR